ncbi:OmpA family protein [Muricoccus radiodurans]|uniref:OmpA family protein n=1 Tax=Muricoccus radiodurans TaxID=2231721 RepID=UPI003CFBB271
MARPERGLILALALLVAACAELSPAGTATPAAAPPPPAPVPFDQAVLNAGNAVFSAAGTGGARRVVVIDPLVNGVTGEQSAATRTLGSRLEALARERYPQFDIRPFNATTVAASPLVMVGTFTPVNAQNQPTGPREAYRFCLVMADLGSGRIAAKGVARALPAGVDATPTRAFAESPTWTEDPGSRAYIDTCQATRAGDPIPPAYLNGIIAAATVNQAIEAYDAGRYREALDLYASARTTPGGDQLRVFNGLYLTRARLGQRAEAEAAFGDLVDYGLRHNRLAVKLLFREGSTAFVADPRVSGDYPMWLRQIATRGAQSSACLEVAGHTSASGSAALNERLSVLRAEAVKARLEGEAPGLRGRVVATGAGAQRPLVGTAANGAADALDRRVEFRTIPAC